MFSIKFPQEVLIVAQSWILQSAHPKYSTPFSLKMTPEQGDSLSLCTKHLSCVRYGVFVRC